MKVIELRLARLERSGAKAPTSYVVRVPADAVHDDEAVRAAIADHQRRTGWMGPVLLVEPEMTQSEWLARYGRAEAR
jgi:hypothetical protein